MDIQSVILTVTCVIVSIAGAIFIGERTAKLVILAKWLYYKRKMTAIETELKHAADMVGLLADVQWEDKYKEVATKFVATQPEIQQYEAPFMAQMYRDFKSFIVGVSTVQQRERLQQVTIKAAPKDLRDEYEEILVTTQQELNMRRQNLIKCGYDVDELEKEFASA